MTRAREIVKHAATLTDDPRARAWLELDERGVWETHAANLLEQTSDRATALGLSAAQVDLECAIVVALLTVETILQSENNPC